MAQSERDAIQKARQRLSHPRVRDFELMVGAKEFRSRMWDSFQRQLLRSLSLTAGLWPGEPTEFNILHEEDSRLKVLLVVAHPDDESECAATLYRISHEIGGIVDQVVITNGEAGLQYSAPAQAYYGPSLDQLAWRKHLVRVRRHELRRAGRVLGIRHHYFLNQKDTGLTLEPREAFETWNAQRIRQELFKLLKREKYDLVFMLLPSPDGHGHHKTAAILTLEAIAQLFEDQRPAALGIQTADAGENPPQCFRALDGYALTRTTKPDPEWGFDRGTPMACHPALDYNIVVNWVVAEHKSQGMFQMECRRRTHEYFWLFDICGATAAARWRAFLQLLEPSTPAPELGTSPKARLQFA